ncbi:uncharacterized protein LOC126575507 [Anopheles aquasalis]|uniref:uncharacterized protein LOC126575507 n=1 Tax=Anopheles aquasalis TaxID=42839 RepID=UPI00215A8354|nr:uncharacterized protein LOC126575507 [Anopheles aquasalis]
MNGGGAFFRTQIDNPSIPPDPVDEYPGPRCYLRVAGRTNATHTTTTATTTTTKEMMYGVHGRLLVWLLLLAPPVSVVVPVSATPVPRKVKSPVSAEELAPVIGYVLHRPPVVVTATPPSPPPPEVPVDSAGNELKDGDPDPEPGCETAARPKRRTPANSDSSTTVWQWLKGNDKPEDNCLLMAIGGVAGGGALTGAFVGAGIGSIFTGPGAIVGGIVGGLVGVFGGLSVGTRAGAVACDSS